MSREVDRLRSELEDAFQNRAHLYRLLLAELEAELGQQQAETMMVRTLERRGREVAEKLFRDVPAKAGAVAERFLAVSPDGGKMYPHDAEGEADDLTIRVRRCPLKDAWTQAELPPGRIATLCRIAGAFDKGLFEAAGIRIQQRDLERRARRRLLLDPPSKPRLSPLSDKLRSKPLALAHEPP